VVVKMRGEEAWRYDTRCALCKGVVAPDEEVFVVGQHVFHGECLERLLSKSPGEFEEVLRHMPLDTHEELRRLYEERRGLPPRGTGLERGTARQGEERGRGRPLTEVERVLRHREAERGAGAEPKRAEEKLRALEEFKNVFWTIYHCVDEGDYERWRYIREKGVLSEALRKAEDVDRAFGVAPPFTFRELLEALALYADDREWCSALSNAATIMWKIILLYEDLLRGRDPPQEGESPPREGVEERVLTREERRKLWGTARKIVDEALREAGRRHPSEMRVDGLGPDYTKFLLALRERVLKLIKEPSRVELRVETHGRGYGDTHVFVDGHYLYTWRPEFDTIRSSFWGWVRRVYNLLRELAEEGLLKEEVLRGSSA